MSTFPVKKFTGGLTDFATGSDTTVFEAADNFLINEYEDLKTRPGTRYDFTSGSFRARVTNQERIGLMAPQETGSNADFTILKQAKSKLYYDNGTTKVELQGPASVEAFPSVLTTASFAAAPWNKHTFLTHEGPTWQRPVKVYRDNSGVLQLRTAGLPRGNFSATTATGTSGGTTAAYIYAFVYAYTYNVGSTQYIDRSRPYLKEYTGIGTTTAANSPGISIDGLADLTNGTGEHYDVANIKIEIYRTLANGSTLYYVGQVDNGAANNPAGGTAAYSDTTSDNALLAAGVFLYTTGGVLGNDRPPKCKYTHGTTDFVYWGNGYEVSTDSSDGQIIPNRGWQSKRGDPDSVPATFYADIEEELTGMSSIKSVPIWFGKNSAYRIDGYFDDQGRGSMVPKKISDGIGCVGHLSIVQTLNGLYFAGNDGFYFTDGSKVIPITNTKFKDTYLTLVDTDQKRKRIYGVFHPEEQLVIWSMQDDDRFPTDEQNVLFVMDLNSGAFTTWSSGFTGNGPFVSESVNVNGTTLTIGSTSGLSAGNAVMVGSDKTAYIVSVDSATTVTLSKSFTNATYAVQFFVDQPIGIEYYSNFQPSSLLFANNKLWQGDGRGFTLYYDQMLVNDVLVDGTIDGTSGTTEISYSKLGILHNYAGPILDLGTTELRKWVNYVIIKMRPRSDLTVVTAVTPYGENDDNDSLLEMDEIYQAGFYPWGTPLLSYGDPRLWRRNQQIVDVKRRFPANSLRCEYKQLHLTSAFVNIINSDVYGVVTIAAGSNSVTRTVTLAGVTSWPTNVVNHWLSFVGDDYTANYKVISRDSSSQVTILVATPGAVSAASNVKWVMRAYPDNNFINLIEYSFDYQVLGNSQSQYIANTGQNS